MSWDVAWQIFDEVNAAWALPPEEVDPMENYIDLSCLTAEEAKAITM